MIRKEEAQLLVVSQQFDNKVVGRLFGPFCAGLARRRGHKARQDVRATIHREAPELEAAAALLRKRRSPTHEAQFKTTLLHEWCG